MERQPNYQIKIINDGVIREPLKAGYKSLLDRIFNTTKKEVNRVGNKMMRTVDDELIELKAFAVEAGHIKLATWGTKRALITFRETGNDKFRSS